ATPATNPCVVAEAPADASAPAAGANAGEAGSPTAVWPIAGRETPCPYCDVAGAAFSQAATSIDVLLASLDPAGDPVADALVAAAARGVSVRVLLDQSDFEPSITEKAAEAVEYLVAHGVEARLDDPAITTHAKLAIVDRVTIIVGSTNWNSYALLEHRQADVRIDDDRVGATFAAFFDRLWADPAAKLPMTFDGVAIPAEGPVLVALPDAGQSTLYGSVVADLLASARESVHAVLYRVSVYPQFEDSATTDLVSALIAAARRGLEVRALLDDCSFYADSAKANLESAIYLYQSGVDVRFDDPAVTTHAKLLVIDGETVVLGSTNWNYYSVERNIEANVALLRMPEIARPFEVYFAGLWVEGRSIVP
ncbi:MAG: phospholipase D-like domain-containing protein, partial [Candidatus Bipolaricaulota bacterium]|nr:phospholipase D-like domain-containing protein [Candidatus Bipolaricaulota bacterium]